MSFESGTRNTIVFYDKNKENINLNFSFSYRGYELSINNNIKERIPGRNEYGSAMTFSKINKNRIFSDIRNLYKNEEEVDIKDNKTKPTSEINLNP